jgi:GxxExxY protein
LERRLKFIAGSALVFSNRIYEKALILELRKRGLLVENQVEIPISYDGVSIGSHVLDLLVETSSSWN